MNLFLTSELLAQMDFYIAIVAPFSHQDFFDVEWRAFNIVRIYKIRLYSKNVCLWPSENWMAADPPESIFYLIFKEKIAS